MKKVVLLVFVCILYSCQSVKVKDKSYNVSNSTIELGAIGKAKSIVGLKNDFQVTTYPQLNEKIKIQITVVPFTKRLNKINLAKAKFNQKQSVVNYVDSLVIKPEVVSIQIADRGQFINELNGIHNKQIVTLAQKNNNLSLVTGVLVNLPSVLIEKIRQADTYYLIQTDDAKYKIALYNDSKKIDLIDVLSKDILGYQISSFCWIENNRNRWEIGDIVSKGKSCKGLTYKKIKKKKEKSLYKM